MTKEEVIKTLHELWRETNDSWYEEVFDMAIEALSEDKTDRMTREEAIADIKNNIKPVVGGKSLDMAIEALSAETHEIRTETHECVSKTHDLISRERTLRAINGYLESIPYIRNTLADIGRRDATMHCLYIIRELPSAEAV